MCSVYGTAEFDRRFQILYILNWKMSYIRESTMMNIGLVQSIGKIGAATRFSSIASIHPRSVTSGFRVAGSEKIHSILINQLIKTPSRTQVQTRLFQPPSNPQRVYHGMKFPPSKSHLENMNE